MLLWFLLYAGMFGLVGVVVWGGWIMPRALRDIWRRAELPEDDLTRLRDASRQRLPEDKPPHLLWRDEP